jgi:glucan endo-1,3-alpha-glucosidase
MSYTWAASDMATIFNAHAVSSAMYKWNGRPLVSTYSGKSYGNAFFAGLKSSLANSGHNISFAPALTDYNEPSQANQMLSDFPSVDGFVNWWAW